MVDCILGKDDVEDQNDISGEGGGDCKSGG